MTDTSWAGALLHAQHATTRQQARDWINVAVLRGLPLGDAFRALREWDEINAPQTVGRCHCRRPVPASSACGCCCAEHDQPPPIPARFDERYDPSPESIDRSIQ